MKMQVLILSALVALSACGEGPKTEVSSSTSAKGILTSSKLLMTDYGVRIALGNNPNTAAYVTIKNGGETPDRLVSASCDCAAEAQLHTMTMADGKMAMAEQTDGFVIAPGETLELKPGGHHIMLLGLTQRPGEGQVVNVTLTFEKAGPVTLAMPASATPLAKH